MRKKIEMRLSVCLSVPGQKNIGSKEHISRTVAEELFLNSSWDPWYLRGK